MTAKVRIARPSPGDVPDAEIDLWHYTKEEAALFLGVSKRWLAGEAAASRIPCTYVARGLKFTARHIRLISAAGEVIPATRGSRSSRTVAA